LQHLKLRPIGGGALRGDCPACGYSQSLTVRTGENNKLLYWCACCQDQAAIYSAMKGVTMEDRPEPTPISTTTDKKQAALDLWRRGENAEKTTVERYLKGRGINLPVPPTIRLLRKHKHLPSGQYFDVMLSAVTVWPENRVTAIHRTYLDLDRKAPVDPAKKTLGLIEGGAIRLGPAESVLAIGEGIETCMSVMQTTGISTWAAMTAGNMKKVALPDTVRHVFLAVDNDKHGVGLRYAMQAKARFESQGRRVSMGMPSEPGRDFNDILSMGAD
jgi:putative DNA primase/helicase